MNLDPETVTFKLNHTALRVRDSAISIPFYQDVLGMALLQQRKFDWCQLFYVGYNRTDGNTPIFEREGVIELQHLPDTEKDPNFKGYASGNEEPGLGFAHLAISVGDIEAACQRFERLGIPFQMRLADSCSKDRAIIRDPDGYWIEINQVPKPGEATQMDG